MKEEISLSARTITKWLAYIRDRSAYFANRVYEILAADVSPRGTFFRYTKKKIFAHFSRKSIDTLSKPK
jgi:hypothetical protein